MKIKRKRPVHKPKATRDTVAKRIAAAIKINENVKALALANYGSDGEAVLSRMAHREVPAGFRPLNEAGLSEFIQDWLLLRAFQTDPFWKDRTDHEQTARIRRRVEFEMVNYFSERLESGDWKFFHNFADKLKAEVAYRDAALLKNRSPIHAELVASKLFDKTVNLTGLAKQFRVSVRRVWEINRAIGAKTVSRGKPRK